MCLNPPKTKLHLFGRNFVGRFGTKFCSFIYRSIGISLSLIQNLVSYIICQTCINKKYGNVQVFKNICMKSKSHLMP